MEETFKRIPPEDVFITVFKRKPTEEELWMGVPPDFDGNRPSGNNLIDLFAYLIRKYGRMDTSEYARIMQLKTSELRGAILAIGGMSAMEWRNRYLLLEAQELMERTDMSITAIAAKLGFSVAIVPKANAPKKPGKALDGLTIYPVERVEQAMELVRTLE